MSAVLAAASKLTNNELGAEIHNIQLPTDVTLTERDVNDLEMFALGAFEPLDGYLTFTDYCSVITTCKLTNGKVWPMPLPLPIKKSACTIPSENKFDSSIINLRDIFGTVLARVHVTSVYQPNLENLQLGLLGSTDPNHPWVAYLNENHKDCIYIGGKIEHVHPVLHFDFTENRLSTKECRDLIKKNGWEVVVGFQTRNPMHRSHFELTVQSLQEAASRTGKPAHLLLTPACGPTQPGDIAAHVRIRCYKKLLPYYAQLGHQDAALVLLPLAMRMSGPREAVWHACIRKNFGCTHFIVGRDHAGPSTCKADGSRFYGPYDAHELVNKFAKEIGIEPLLGKAMMYCGPERGYVQEDKLAAGEKGQSISGTRLREMLRNREPVPEWYSFPAVVRELQSLYKQKHEQGFCLYFTGLPCSGKSTLATALEAALHENENETRRVTYLDADVIRTHLSKGLGFSKEDRSANVRRIGFVAGVTVKHGGICLVANIAPYAEDRMFNRRFIEQQDGGYIEVHVSTPLDVCETRDVKGLYAKARAGIISQFTGISDPYEVPKSPELIVDSSTDIRARVHEIMEYLRKEGWVR